MDVSVIVCTANREHGLRATLDSLASVRPVGSTELLVVDNGSRDATRTVIEEAAERFPYPVRYLFAPEEGKYAALNAGIRAARGSVIAATDDDARFEPNWLERAVEGLSRHGCEFVGGIVRPLWCGPKPAWLNERAPLHAKVIALLDQGDEVREFGRGMGWPLGVNVAYRREVFERVGLFEKRLGRKFGTLRNQAQLEWHLRAREAGARGFYLPDMVVHHMVAPERLHKRYFRRWFYWHGISRALLYRYSGYDIDEPGLESSHHPDDREIAGVPRRLIVKALRSMRSFVWHGLNGHRHEAFQRELWLCFFVGVVRQRWVDRNLPVAQGSATVPTSHPSVHPTSASQVDLVSRSEQRPLY
jgi:glucosyl-dolichyl phosphate glucuronosyltransferase